MPLRRSSHTHRRQTHSKKRTETRNQNSKGETVRSRLFPYDASFFASFGLTRVGRRARSARSVIVCKHKGGKDRNNCPKGRRPCAEPRNLPQKNIRRTVFPTDVDRFADPFTARSALHPEALRHSVRNPCTDANGRTSRRAGRGRDRSARFREGREARGR